MIKRQLPKELFLKKLIPFIVLESVMTLALVAVILIKKDNLVPFIPVIILLVCAPIYMLVKQLKNFNCAQCRRPAAFQNKNSEVGFYCKMCDVLWEIKSTVKPQSD